MSKACEAGLLQRILRVSSQQADLILRIALGGVFFAHGSQKLFGWFGGHGWSATIGFFSQGLNIPVSLGGLVILIEFFGGLAIILGLLTRPAALGLLATMLGAAFKVHLANGFFLDLSGTKDGVEYVFVLFLLALYFVIKGSGLISLDRLLAGKTVGK